MLNSMWWDFTVSKGPFEGKTGSSPCQTFRSETLPCSCSQWSAGEGISQLSHSNAIKHVDACHVFICGLSNVNMYVFFPTSSILAVNAAFREYSLSFSKLAGGTFKWKMMWLYNLWNTKEVWDVLLGKQFSQFTKPWEAKATFTAAMPGTSCFTSSIARATQRGLTQLETDGSRILVVGVGIAIGLRDSYVQNCQGTFFSWELC